MLRIDIVLITHNRPELLQKCLISLQQAAARSSQFANLHLRIGINGPDKNSSELIQTVCKSSTNFTFSVLFLSEALKPSEARNRLIENARGDWIFFIDDDAFIDSDFFLTFGKSLRDHPNATVIGGPNLTPKGSSFFQRASGYALSSRFGSFLSSARYQSIGQSSRCCGDESLILCNLFFLRESFHTQKFPAGMICNEENWVLQNLLASGSTLIYVPKLFVWHERRPRPIQFAAQVHKYGIGRRQNIRNKPKSLAFIHVVPAFCLLFSGLTAITGHWWPQLQSVWLFLFLCYLLAWAVATIRLYLKSRADEDFGIGLLGGLLLPLIHITYGTGVLRGLTLGRVLK